MSDLQGFPPIERPDATTLILGSFPGVQSLEAQQYYAHSRNAFWRIMGELLGADPGSPYEERTDDLRTHGIALWDVLASCERSGSLDSAIVEATAATNDFVRFFAEHPDTNRVCFNGKKAEKLYRRFVLPALGQTRVAIRYEILPSTSPALASMSYEEKLERWSVIRSSGG